MEKMATVLQALADKLGVTVEHLWGVLVRQAHNALIEQIGWYIVALVALVVLIGFMRLSYEKTKKDEGWWIGVIVPAFLVAFILAGVMSSIGATLALINNPEYYALQKVLRVLAAQQ